jgi:tRNA dimethylallyltransferase
MELARRNDGVVINADSLQMYRGLPILSAQPEGNYRELVEHRMYSIYSPYQRGSVFNWLQSAVDEIKMAIERRKLPIVVGGTGMYLSRLVNGIREIPNTDLDLRRELNAMYSVLGWDRFCRIVGKIDPLGASRITYHDRQRLIRLYEVYRLTGRKLSELENIPNNSVFDRRDIFLLNVLPDRDIIYNRCELRFKTFLNDAIGEVQEFMREYPDLSKEDYPVSHTLGFSEIVQYVSGKLSRDCMINLAIKNTKHYAKRQYTWFRNQFGRIDFLLKHIPNKEYLNKLIEEVSIKILKS